MAHYKIPVSVQVVVHTADWQVLLLERADHPGYWQSVTGSQSEGEDLADTAIREVEEETGLDAKEYRLTDWGLEYRFEIFLEWRHRYAPGTTHNDEHVFGLLLPEALPIRINPREHTGFVWLPYLEAAEKVFSWSNALAIRRLPEFAPQS
jgi:dATP pyrophosphohydrolase